MTITVTVTVVMLKSQQSAWHHQLHAASDTGQHLQTQLLDGALSDSSRLLKLLNIISHQELKKCVPGKEQGCRYYSAPDSTSTKH